MRVRMTDNVFNHHMDWEKSESGIWKGKSNRFYRFGRDHSLFTSADLKDWEYTIENSWRDINSRYIKVIDFSLFSSSDKENWTLLKDRSWQSPSGVMYKLDENLNLYIKSTEKPDRQIRMQN